MTDRAREVLAEEVDRLEQTSIRSKHGTCTDNWEVTVKAAVNAAIRYAAEREAAERERLHALLKQQALAMVGPGTRVGVAIAASTVKRGRLLTERERMDNLMTALNEDNPEASAPQPMAGGDGWIEWKGGPRPDATRVEVRNRIGKTSCRYPIGVCWEHNCPAHHAEHDIVAYRILEPSLVPSQPDTGTKDWRDELADILDMIGSRAVRLDNEPLTFNYLDEIVYQLRKPALQRLSKGKNDGAL